MQAPHPPKGPKALMFLCWLGLGLTADPAVARPLDARDDRVLTGFAARRGRMPAGSVLMGRLSAATPWEREARLLAEVRRGNVPDFLRELRTVRMRLPDGAGRWRQVVIRVLPDYLAVGTDQDFVRIPLTPAGAQRLADDLGMALPTPRIVDLVHRRATLRLTPQPLIKDRQLTSVRSLLRHETLIGSQLYERRAGLGCLVSGHKKDVVLTRRLWRRPDRVAIYGWHRPDGEPIQPLSLAHDRVYADYSHGVRLVSGTVLIDGRAHSLESVLADRILAPLLSDEGRLAAVRIPEPSTPLAFVGRP